MFEARRDIHGRPKVIQRVARGDGDARSGMNAELQHNGRRGMGGIEGCDIVLDRKRRANSIIGAGEGGHDRVTHGLDDEAMIALNPVRQEREMVANEV